MTDGPVRVAAALVPRPRGRTGRALPTGSAGRGGAVLERGTTRRHHRDRRPGAGSPVDRGASESAARGSETRAALRRFVGVGLLALGVIAVVAVSVAWTLAGRQALHEMELATQRIADQTVGPFLEDAVRGDPRAYVTLDRIVDARMSDGSVLSITVWDPADWRVVYSDEAEFTGTRSPRPPWVEPLVASGEPVARVVEVTGVDGGPTDTGGVVEAYTSWTAGEAPLVVEAHYDDEVVRLHQRSLLLLLLPVALVGLALLQLTQLPLALRLAGRLEASADTQRRLLRQAIAAGDVERRRIARDLHDEVIQDLAGAAYALDAVESALPAGSRPLAGRATEAVKHSVAKLRGVLTELYPVDFDDVTLPDAIRDLARPLEAAGTAVDLDLPADVDLDRSTATLVYRVVRESLHNAAQHARSGHVSVRLRVTGDEAHLRVADDGVGFDPARAGQRGHLGLHLVRDTVAEAGGAVSITSAPGEGTCVQMRLPLV